MIILSENENVNALINAILLEKKPPTKTLIKFNTTFLLLMRFTKLFVFTIFGMVMRSASNSLSAAPAGYEKLISSISKYTALSESIPTEEPTYAPPPTKPPIFRPTKKPTPTPTFKPTFSPIQPPTKKPTPNPTIKYTVNPTTRKPSPAPVSKPSKMPVSKMPSLLPTSYPTSKPTAKPTAKPVVQSKIPTCQPYDTPTILPSMDPSSDSPTPTPYPTPNPTPYPTTPYPTTSSSIGPTPSLSPSQTPAPPTNMRNSSATSQHPLHSPTSYPSFSPYIIGNSSTGSGGVFRANAVVGQPLEQTTVFIASVSSGGFFMAACITLILCICKHRSKYVRAPRAPANKALRL